MYTLNEILAAYKDCGISYATALNMITSSPPNGLGFPTQTAIDYLNNEQRNCGSVTPIEPISNPVSPVYPSDTAVDSGRFQIPDNFYGFLLLLGGLS